MGLPFTYRNRILLLARIMGIAWLVGGAYFLMSALAFPEDKVVGIVVGLLFAIGGFAIIFVKIPRLIRTDRSDQRLASHF